MASGARLRLVLLSFLMLFVELALIRWTGANNVHLAYLTNFVLLASFLGIGVGFLRAERGPELFPWAPVALALLVGFVLAFPVDLTTLEGSGGLRGAFGMAALFVLLLGRRIQLVALVAVVTLLAIESADSHDHWSPYYKITATHTAQTKVAGVPTHDVLTISANNIPHQTAYPIATLRRIER